MVIKGDLRFAVAIIRSRVLNAECIKHGSFHLLIKNGIFVIDGGSSVGLH